METTDKPVYPNMTMMFGDDDCWSGEQSLAPNVFFSKLFDVLQMSSDTFPGIPQFMGEHEAHTKGDIQLEHVEGGWDYAQ